MREKKQKLLDSSALLAYLNRERGFESVRSLLRSAREHGEDLLLNDINLGEVFYAIARRTSLAGAERILRSMRSMPIQVVGNSTAEVLSAARLKAQYPIAYGDSFAVASALRLNAVLVTADGEFASVANLVQIHWVPAHT